MALTLLRRKPLDEILAGADAEGYRLKRTLGAFDLTLLGIGAIVGAGIFTSIGTAAAGDASRPGAGPSLMLSFVITATVAALTALCYAEMAAMVPISGSAYTYSYATLGEIIAWIIGWDLIIEYAVGNVAVAISWGNYFRALVSALGYDIPRWLTTDFRTAAQIPGLLESAPHIFGVPIALNLFAFLIVSAITIVLVWGVRESASFNSGMVIVKLVVLVFFIIAAAVYVSPAEMVKNWTPFAPQGFSGTLHGAAVAFFAYIGFDAVSTVAEETKRPARDLPIGIFASLAICTVLYVLVAGAFTGMVPYPELAARLSNEQAEPLTMALSRVAPGARWVSILVAGGAVVANTAVLLVFQMGQPRIFFSMARDGLLPPVFARVHPRFRTPHVTTIITGIVVGLFGAVASIDEMVDLTNIGTLFAFVLVCVGIPILRLRDPDRARPFRVPLGPWFVPVLGALSCVFLMVYLPPASWWRFIGWLTLGLSVYAAYGYNHSGVGRAAGRSSRLPLGNKIAAPGLVAAAVGLFIVPHSARPTEILTLATSAGEGHGRAVAGLTLLGLGLVVAAVGALISRAARRPSQA